MLKLYINGALVAKSTRFDPSAYDLANRHPLLLGFGQHDHFNGKMLDLRIYRRALSDSELRTLVSSSR